MNQGIRACEAHVVKAGEPNKVFSELIFSELSLASFAAGYD